MSATAQAPSSTPTVVSFLARPSPRNSSSKYKGVVPQSNGHSGAQIYKKHQRVWVGTFNEEDKAARAYNIVAQHFRGRDAVTNLKPFAAIAESEFLNSHSKFEILLHKHTYDNKLQHNTRGGRRRHNADTALSGVCDTKAPSSPLRISQSSPLHGLLQANDSQDCVTSYLNDHQAIVSSSMAYIRSNERP
ncbi:hypothetical protein JHK85_034604 [Glycine max]|nr:hypothetical protein JHK85_034604 [Glycine max]